MRSTNARISDYIDSSYYDLGGKYWYDLGGKYWIDGVIVKREDFVDHFAFREKMKDRLGLKTIIEQ